MTDKFKQDYELGKKTEAYILETIREYFNDDIKPSQNNFSKCDYIGGKYNYELKTRRFEYQKYPTTIIPSDKIEGDKKICFLFKFTDGLYYIKYRKSKFDNFELKDFRRYDRGFKFDKLKPYYFIPIDKLKKIC